MLISQDLARWTYVKKFSNSRLKNADEKLFIEIKKG